MQLFHGNRMGPEHLLQRGVLMSDAARTLTDVCIGSVSVTHSPPFPESPFPHKRLPPPACTDDQGSCDRS